MPRRAGRTRGRRERQITPLHCLFDKFAAADVIRTCLHLALGRAGERGQIIDVLFTRASAAEPKRNSTARRASAAVRGSFRN